MASLQHQEQLFIQRRPRPGPGASSSDRTNQVVVSGDKSAYASDVSIFAVKAKRQHAPVFRPPPIPQPLFRPPHFAQHAFHPQPSPYSPPPLQLLPPAFFSPDGSPVFYQHDPFSSRPDFLDIQHASRIGHHPSWSPLALSTASFPPAFAPERRVTRLDEYSVAVEASRRQDEARLALQHQEMLAQQNLVRSHQLDPERWQAQPPPFEVLSRPSNFEPPPVLTGLGISFPQILEDRLQHPAATQVQDLQDVIDLKAQELRELLALSRARRITAPAALPEPQALAFPCVSSSLSIHLRDRLLILASGRQARVVPRSDIFQLLLPSAY